MEISQSQSNGSATQAEEAMDEARYQELVEILPKERGWIEGSNLYFYQGFWCPSRCLKGISFLNHFQALDNDIIIASVPKSGSTWLKSLIFTIVNRKHLNNSPLLSSNPHDIVPNLEFEVYSGKNPSLYLENNPFNPRIFSTHTPYASLPASIKNSNCKIVYLCRNPMDMFISYWNFMDKIRPENVNLVSLNEAFDMFCKGIHGFGPYVDHVLGFWEAANTKSGVGNKIIFLKYEDLKEDIVFQIKQLAEFLELSFSREEEEQGVVEQVVKLCSFENLKNLEINKVGKRPAGIPNFTFFRKGVVGDWSNYLTPSMLQRLENLVREKLHKTGLTFTKQFSYPKQ